MIKFRVYPDARERLKGLKIGYVQFDEIRVRRTSFELDIMVEVATTEVLDKFPDISSITKDPVIKGVRRLFSRIGLDPTKERPSGEALIRRVVNGEGIHRINMVADVNNIISMTTGYPCGVYDADNTKGVIRILIGKPGGKYIGIGGKERNTENRLLTKDDISIFGGPTSDSERTSIHTGTQRVIMLIYHPPDVPIKYLENAINEAKSKMVEINRCKVVDSGIFEAEYAPS